MRMALTAAVAASLLAAMPLAAKTPKDQLIVGMNMSNMLGLDTAEYTQFEPSHIQANVYDQLVAKDPSDLTVTLPLLAEKIEIAPGGTITFTLREGVKFHSGRLITAEDAAWSYRRARLLNKSGSNQWKSWGYTAENIVTKVRAVDARTMVVEPAAPVSPSLKLVYFAQASGSVLDKDLVLANEKAGDLGNAFLSTNSAGSGPFKINRWNPNDVLILDRHDGYWGQVAKIRRVVVRHIPESQSQRLQLEKGDLDVGYTLSGADFDGLEKNPEIVIERVPGGGFYYFSINMKDPDLGRSEVREALRWCIDYEGINTGIMRNYGILWRRQVLPGVVGSLPDLDYRLDVDRCKAGLAAAGYPNGFKKSMRALSAPPFAEIATAVQATMAKAGVELTILPGNGEQVYGLMRDRNFETLVGRSGGGLVPDAHDTLRSNAYNQDNRDEAKLTGQIAWRASWFVPEVNRLIEAGMAEVEQDKRRGIYEEVQVRIEEAVPFAWPISQRLDPFARTTRVQGYPVDPTWMVRWELVSKAD